MVRSGKKTQTCLLYFAINSPSHRDTWILHPDEAPASATTLPKEEVNATLIDNGVNAATQTKEEVVDAAPQPKEEANAVDDDIPPEICLNHLPVTEQVGGQHTPSRALAAKSLAVEAPASIP